MLVGCRDWGFQYSHFTTLLPTRSFLAPLQEDEEIEVSTVLRAASQCSGCASVPCCHGLRVAAETGNAPQSCCLSCLKGTCAVQVALGPGVVVSIKYKAVSELLPNGMKEGAAHVGI